MSAGDFFAAGLALLAAGAFTWPFHLLTRADVRRRVASSARALGLAPSGVGLEGTVHGHRVVVRHGTPPRLEVFDRRALGVSIGSRADAIRAESGTGDPDFDAMATVRGEPIEVAVALTASARNAIIVAIAGGWNHSGGAWMRDLRPAHPDVTAALVDEAVRVARALAWSPDEAIERLIDTAAHDPIEDYRRRALAALGQAFANDPRTMALVARLVATTSGELRRAALMASVDLPLLGEIARDAHAPWRDRVAALARLCELAPTRAREAESLDLGLLGRALELPGEERDRARAVLREIGDGRGVALLETTLGPLAARDVAAIRARLGSVGIGGLALVEADGGGDLALAEAPGPARPHGADRPDKRPADLGLADVAARLVDDARPRGKVPP